MVLDPTPIKCPLCGDSLPLGTEPSPNGVACDSCRRKGEAELEASFPDMPVRFTQPERAMLASYGIKLRQLRPELAHFPTRCLVRLLITEHVSALLGVAEDAPHVRVMRSLILATSCSKCGATLRVERVHEVQKCKECGTSNLPPGETTAPGTTRVVRP